MRGGAGGGGRGSLKASELHEALTIILAREPEAKLRVGFDIIRAGTAESDAYTEADRKRLDALGWFEDQEAWAHFT